ncbi:MAG: hypothetical protein QG673_908 [Pseudomonadota bacterium]|nr:hypothetical protein [Pseudomonadota bacterium]
MVFKKFVSYAIFSIIASGINFITSLYLAKVLTPSDLGIIGLFQAYLFAATPAITFSGLGLVAINQVTLPQSKFQSFANSYFTLSIFMFILLLVIAGIITIYYPSYFFLIIAIPIFTFFRLFSDFHNSILVQMHRAQFYGVLSLIENLIALILTVVLLQLFNFTWGGRLTALILAAIAILIIRYLNGFTALRNFRFDFKRNGIIDIIKYGFPLLISEVASWVINNGDRIIVAHYFTLHDVGIYTLAVSFGSIISIINIATINAIMPVIYQALHVGMAKKIIVKYSLLYGIFILFMALIVGIGSYWYIPLFFGNKYIQSQSLIIWIAFLFAFSGIYKTTGVIVDFFKKTKLKTVLLYISALSSLVVSISLIPVVGLKAPAIGAMVGYFIFAFLTCIYGWKILNQNGIL